MFEDNPIPSSHPDPARTASFLLVRIGSHDFGVPASVVRQLIPNPELTPLRASPPWCSGILFFGEAAVPVVSTHYLIGATVEGPPRAAVVVQHNQSPEFSLLALAVDRLTATVPIRPYELLPIRTASSLPFRRHVSAAWRGRSRPCYILNLDTLIPVNELHLLPALLRNSF